MKDTEKKDRHQVAPFPLRMDSDVRKALERARVLEDRSMNWIINDRLRAALGMKVAA